MYKRIRIHVYTVYACTTQKCVTLDCLSAWAHAILQSVVSGLSNDLRETRICLKSVLLITGTILDLHIWDHGIFTSNDLREKRICLKLVLLISTTIFESIWWLVYKVSAFDHQKHWNPGLQTKRTNTKDLSQIGSFNHHYNRPDICLTSITSSACAQLSVLR